MRELTVNYSPAAKFLVTDWTDLVDSGIRLPYRLIEYTSLISLIGRELLFFSFFLKVADICLLLD